MEYYVEEVNKDVQKHVVTCTNGFFTLFDHATFALFLALALFCFYQALMTPTLWVSRGIIFLLVTCVCWFVARIQWRRKSVREESLLVTRELGVQFNTTFFDGTEKFDFVDKSRIKTVIINEGITCGDIIFYMAFIVEGRNKMLIAFENLRPRRKILLNVFHGTRELVFGD